MPISNFAKSFGNAVKSVLPIVVGVPESVFSGVSDRYRIELVAHEGGNYAGFGKGDQIFRINAYLQDKITLTGSSTWSNIAQDMPFYKKMVKQLDNLGQSIFARTAQAAISTNRKWDGSSPIGLNLKLKFEAVRDVETEVLAPCRLLQGLTLPRGGVANFGLITPGPNGFTNTQEEGNSRGETVVINIGNFIQFYSVIINTVKVTYENRMSDEGPIGAEVDLGIETWRMITREELNESYANNLSITRGGDLQGVLPRVGADQ